MGLQQFQPQQIRVAVGQVHRGRLLGDRLAGGERPLATILLPAQRHKVLAAFLPDGSIVARNHNRREERGDATAHAEMLVISDRSRDLGDWRLTGHTLVVTLEPCTMCAGAMVNARLGQLVYGATDPKAGAAGSVFDITGSTELNHRVPVTPGVLADECGTLLREFFAARR